VFPQYRRAGDNESRHVHNLPLELVADLGTVPGLAGAVLFFVAFLGPLRRTGREAPSWHRGLSVGLAAFALHNLADFTAFLPSLLWTAAIGRGLLSRARVDPGRQPSRASALLLLALVWLAAAALVATGLSANALHRARTAALAGEHDIALATGKQAATLAPWDPDAHLLEAQAWLASADPGEALRPAGLAVERAIRLSPVRPAARAVRARVRLASGDLPGAYADLFEAARLYPMNEDYLRQRDALAAQLPRHPAGNAP
jgi:tetratricopeptide (TPR) repeat protein